MSEQNSHMDLYFLFLNQTIKSVLIVSYCIILTRRVLWRYHTTGGMLWRIYTNRGSHTTRGILWGNYTTRGSHTIGGMLWGYHTTRGSHTTRGMLWGGLTTRGSHRATRNHTTRGGHTAKGSHTARYTNWTTECRAWLITKLHLIIIVIIVTWILFGIGFSCDLLKHES